MKWISLQLPDQVVQLVHHIGELTGHGVVLCLSGLVLKKAGEDCGETGLKQRTAGGLGDVGGKLDEAVESHLPGGQGEAGVLEVGDG